MTRMSPGSDSRWPRRSDSDDVERARRLDAQRARGGERGERVAAHVGRRERQRRAPPGARRRRRRRRTSPSSDRRAGAPPAAPRRPAPRPSRRARGPAISSAFAAAIASIVPSSSRCTGPTAVMTPTSGAAIAVSSAIWPAPRIPISSTSACVPARRGEDRQRQPDLGVEVLRVGHRAQALAEHRREQVLGRRLADRAGDRDDRARELVAPRVGQRAERDDGVVGRRARPRRRRRSASACWGSTSTPHAPASSARAANAPPSTRSPRMPTNRSPGRTSRESMLTRCGPAAAGAGRDEPRPGGAGDALRRPFAHAAPPVRPSTSSNGVTTPPASWPCSWPLPATTTTSPARASSTASPIAARRSSSTVAPGARAGDDLGDDRLRVLRARVVRRDDHDVGQLARRGAHQRSLAAVAVAAGAEDADHAPVAERARRAQHVGQRVRRVGVVDDEREVLALVDRLEAARHARRRAQAGGDRVVADAERARRGDRAQRVEDVERARAAARSARGRRGGTSTRPARAARRSPAAPRRRCRGRPSPRPGSAAASRRP